MYKPISPPVLLVEDDELLRNSLVEFLSLCDIDVTPVDNGAAFINEISSGRFSVCVIDLRLPDIDGQLLVKHVRDQTETPIIVLTALNDLDLRIESYNTGADLFLSKPVDGKELAAAICSLSSRRISTASPGITKSDEAASWMLSERARKIKAPNGKIASLTVKEYDIVTALARQKEGMLSRSHLASQIYGRDDESAMRALETCIGRLRKKLYDFTGDSSLIITWHGIGYGLTAAVYPLKAVDCQ